MTERHLSPAEIAEWCDAHPERLVRPRLTARERKLLASLDGVSHVESQGSAQRKRRDRLARNHGYRRGTR